MPEKLVEPNGAEESHCGDDLGFPERAARGASGAIGAKLGLAGSVEVPAGPPFSAA